MLSELYAQIYLQHSYESMLKRSRMNSCLQFSKIEHWYDEDIDETINVCSECLSKRRQLGRDWVGRQKVKSWTKDKESKPDLEVVTEEDYSTKKKMSNK